MADDAVFAAATGQGLVVSTGILGDLVLPEGAFDPDHADEIRALAAQAAPNRCRTASVLRKSKRSLFPAKATTSSGTGMSSPSPSP